MARRVPAPARRLFLFGWHDLPVRTHALQQKRRTRAFRLQVVIGTFRNPDHRKLRATCRCGETSPRFPTYETRGRPSSNALLTCAGGNSRTRRTRVQRSKVPPPRLHEDGLHLATPWTAPLQRRNLRRGTLYEYFGGTVKHATIKKATNPVDKHVGSRVRMRRLMLGMSQTKLADGLGLTFQQVQKYEKGANRMGASRLQHISHLLQVPVPFFFEGAPHLSGQPGFGTAPSPAYVSDFLATTDGLALTKAFMQIMEPTLRRRIVALVEEIAGDDLN